LTVSTASLTDIFIFSVNIYLGTDEELGEVICVTT
jgi:hypothetical protein